MEKKQIEEPFYATILSEMSKETTKRFYQTYIVPLVGERFKIVGQNECLMYVAEIDEERSKDKRIPPIAFTYETMELRSIRLVCEVNKNSKFICFYHDELEEELQQPEFEF